MSDGKQTEGATRVSNLEFVGEGFSGSEPRNGVVRSGDEPQTDGNVGGENTRDDNLYINRDGLSRHRSASCCAVPMVEDGDDDRLLLLPPPSSESKSAICNGNKIHSGDQATPNKLRQSSDGTIDSAHLINKRRHIITCRRARAEPTANHVNSNESDKSTGLLEQNASRCFIGGEMMTINAVDRMGGRLKANTLPSNTSDKQIKSLSRYNNNNNKIATNSSTRKLCTREPTATTNQHDSHRRRLIRHSIDGKLARLERCCNRCINYCNDDFAYGGGGGDSLNASDRYGDGNESVEADDRYCCRNCYYVCANSRRRQQRLSSSSSSPSSSPRTQARQRPRRRLRRHSEPLGVWPTIRMPRRAVCCSVAGKVSVKKLENNEEEEVECKQVSVCAEKNNNNIDSPPLMATTCHQREQVARELDYSKVGDATAACRTRRADQLGTPSELETSEQSVGSSDGKDFHRAADSFVANVEHQELEEINPTATSEKRQRNNSIAHLNCNKGCEQSNRKKRINYLLRKNEWKPRNTNKVQRQLDSRELLRPNAPAARRQQKLIRQRARRRRRRTTIVGFEEKEQILLRGDCRRGGGVGLREGQEQEKEQKRKREQKQQLQLRRWQSISYEQPQEQHPHHRLPLSTSSVGSSPRFSSSSSCCSLGRCSFSSLLSSTSLVSLDKLSSSYASVESNESATTTTTTTSAPSTSATIRATERLSGSGCSLETFGGGYSSPLDIGDSRAQRKANFDLAGGANSQSSIELNERRLRSQAARSSGEPSPASDTNNLKLQQISKDQSNRRPASGTDYSIQIRSFSPSLSPRPPPSVGKIAKTIDSTEGDEGESPQRSDFANHRRQLNAFANYGDDGGSSSSPEAQAAQEARATTAAGLAVPAAAGPTTTKSSTLHVQSQDEDREEEVNRAKIVEQQKRADLINASEKKFINQRELIDIEDKLNINKNTKQLPMLIKSDHTSHENKPNSQLFNVALDDYYCFDKSKSPPPPTTTTTFQQLNSLNHSSIFCNEEENLTDIDLVAVNNSGGNSTADLNHHHHQDQTSGHHIPIAGSRVDPNEMETLYRRKPIFQFGQQLQSPQRHSPKRKSFKQSKSLILASAQNYHNDQSDLSSSAVGNYLVPKKTLPNNTFIEDLSKCHSDITHFCPRATRATSSAINLIKSCWSPLVRSSRERTSSRGKQQTTRLESISYNVMNSPTLSYHSNETQESTNDSGQPKENAMEGLSCSRLAATAEATTATATTTTTTLPTVRGKRRNIHYKMPESIARVDTTLNAEDYDRAISVLNSDIRFKLHLLLYRRVQTIWTLFSTLFCILIPLLLSNLETFIIIAACVSWLSLQTVGFILTTQFRKKLDQMLENSVAQVNSFFSDHNLMIGVINVGSMLTKARLLIPILYFDTSQCRCARSFQLTNPDEPTSTIRCSVPPSLEHLNEPPQPTNDQQNQEQIESIVSNDSREDADGKADKRILDYSKIGLPLSESANISTLAQSQLAKKIVLRYSQRWISHFDRRKLTFADDGTKPRHLSTGKCLCQFIEEHFKNNRNHKEPTESSNNNNTSRGADDHFVATKRSDRNKRKQKQFVATTKIGKRKLATKLTANRSESDQQQKQQQQQQQQQLLQRRQNDPQLLNKNDFVSIDIEANETSAKRQRDHNDGHLSTEIIINSKLLRNIAQAVPTLSHLVQGNNQANSCNQFYIDIARGAQANSFDQTDDDGSEVQLDSNNNNSNSNNCHNGSNTDDDTDGCTINGIDSFATNGSIKPPGCAANSNNNNNSSTQSPISDISLDLDNDLMSEDDLIKKLRFLLEMRKSENTNGSISLDDNLFKQQQQQYTSVDVYEESNNNNVKSGHLLSNQIRNVNSSKQQRHKFDENSKETSIKSGKKFFSQSGEGLSFFSAKKSNPPHHHHQVNSIVEIC